MDKLPEPSQTPVIYIYALRDPDSGAFRYVGKSNRPQLRYKQHNVPRLLRKKCHKNSWILSLKARGLKPLLQILQCVPEAVWQEAECGWIAKLTAFGCDLVNLTPGGDGGPLSEETKAKLRAINLGKKNGPPSEETRRKISEAHMGRKLPPERVAKMRLVNLGKPSWNKGLHHRPETCAKLSREWRLVDPEGQTILVRNLKQFCKENGLQDALMHHVATGKRKSHKGWTCQRADV